MYGAWRIFLVAAALVWGACITGKDDPVTGDGRPPVSDGGKADSGNDSSGKDGGGKDGGGKDSGASPFGAFAKIAAGGFTMGVAHQEACGDTIKEARHKVTLTRGFEILKTEVTQGQFKKLMGYNPARFQGTDASNKSTYCGGASCDQHPVEKVTWHEAAHYCNRLSEKLGYKARCYECTGAAAKVTCAVHWAFDSAGKTIFDCPAFRLPSEAEWEYAYRAKTTTAYYNGDNDTACYICTTPEAKANAIAWYCANASDRTHPVGRKMPNAWGLSDMAGNVEEWTQDWHAIALGNKDAKDPLNTTPATYRTTRGGRFDGHPKFLRAANRTRRSPTNKDYQVGFRVVRTVK